jgi:hypothetical protein
MVIGWYLLTLHRYGSQFQAFFGGPVSGRVSGIVPVPQPNRTFRIFFMFPCRIHWPKCSPEASLSLCDVEDAIGAKAEA